jgi:cobalt/nickel transport system permease protein
MSPPLRIITAFLFAWWVVLYHKPTAFLFIPFFFVASPISLKLLISRLFQLNIFLFPLLLWFVIVKSPNQEFFWQANVILSNITILLGNIDAFLFAKALQQLKVSNKLIYLLFFTIRYLEVLKQTFQQIQRAMQIRGFKLQTTLHTYQSIGNALGMLFVKSLSKAQRIEQAMRCRGFQGQFPPANLEKCNIADYLYLSGFLGLASFLTILN